MPKISEKVFKIIIVLLLVISILEALYLTYNHFFDPLSICTASIFGDCGRVLQSEYSVVFGIPLAILGLFHYLFLAYFFWNAFATEEKIYKQVLFIQTLIGLAVSVYLFYIQIAFIGALCQYCLLSGLISLLLYILIRLQWRRDYKTLVLWKLEMLYKLFAKPILFLLPADFIHDKAMFWGEIAGSIPLKRFLFRHILFFKHPSIKQKIAGITFENPVGLSAGYDYKGAFVQILPSVGFGFETVGTISNHPCQGNEAPRLGRLPKSKSLLVNKGFRNPGADAIIHKFKSKKFKFPVGISIGKTNSLKLAGTQETAVNDVVSAFKKFEKSKIKHSYYELNISCPNLKGGVSFYPPKELKILLSAIDKLTIKKPVFVKMPIEKLNSEVQEMLEVIIKYKWIKGVIFGNLLKDRNNASFVKEEVQKAGKGNFSGKPTYRRSNELIRLAYREYGKRLIIIGCGGVFTAGDAYLKIRLGASLVQMISGMIFEGPQRISQINIGLTELLQQDGFKNISEAVGVDAQNAQREAHNT